MEEKETKGTGRKITTVVIVLLLAGLLGGAYVHGINYFKTHFFTNTGIDGVDVGELTAAEAEQKLAEAFDVNNITIEGRDRSEELDVSEAGITRRYSGLEEAVASQDAVKWVFKRMEAAELELPYSFEYDEQKLLELADGIDQLREENQKAPENAYVGYDEASDSFIVVPEDRGSTIDTDKFHEVIKAAAEAGNSSIVLDNENVYYEPEIGSDDPELNSRAEYVNKLNCGTIRLDLGADTELTLRGDSILGLLDIGMFVENCTNGTPSDDSFVNEEALNGLVAKLSEKYNTYDPDKSKLFTTYSGENILIENEYGWKLNEEKTAAALRKRLQEICNAVILGDQDEFAVSEDNKDPNYIKASWSHSA
ncbi:MAG: hypothetical protein Q4E57_09710, partial [Eubacteriales bacterium]|nr:hypothetical protein [Eubacteriales bacterium]